MTRDLACKLSVVCPVHEEKDLPRFHFELVASLASLPPECSVEILYVDDGSQDGTLAQLRRLAACDCSVQYLSFSRRFGKQAALSAGIEHASGDVVILLDAKIQPPPGLLPDLLARWREGYDVVLTRAADNPHQGRLERLSSWACRQALRWLSDTPVSPTPTDYCLLARPAVDSLMRLPEVHRHLRGMVQWIGFRTTTVTLPPDPRGQAVEGSARRMLSLAVDEMLSFSKLPLRCSLVLGLVAGLLGMGQGACCAMHLLNRTPTLPWLQEVMLLAVLLGGGFILCVLGVLGEYVGRVYEQVKGRPLYLVKEASSPPVAPTGQVVSWCVREPRVGW